VNFDILKKAECPLFLPPLSLVNVSLESGVQGVQGVAEGGVAALTGAIGGLDGVPFTVSVDWGQGQTPSSASFAPGSAIYQGTSFSMSHYYDDAGGTFASAFGPTVTVTTSDGRSVTYGMPAVQGVSPAPAVQISMPQLVDMGNSVTASAIVNDPGQYETFTYSWQAWLKSPMGWTLREVTSGSSATINFPTDSSEPGDHVEADLQVTNAEGVTTSVASSVFVDPSGDPPIGSNAIVDTPTVTVTEIDPGATVVAGTSAQFDIHLDPGPAGTIKGIVTVWYSTKDGSATSPTNYQSTGEQSWEFGVGQRDAIITVPTNPGMNGGNFSLQVGNLYDPFAAAGYNGGNVVTAVATITPSITRTYANVTSPAQLGQSYACGGMSNSDSNTIVIFIGHTFNVRGMIENYLKTTPKPPKLGSVALAMACQSRQGPVLGDLQDYYGRLLDQFPWVWTDAKTTFGDGFRYLMTDIPSLITAGTNNFSWGSAHFLNIRIVMDYERRKGVRPLCWSPAVKAGTRSP
jgi:hypothetical protein